MDSREYNPDQNVVFTDDGEIINPADATNLPMSNEARIARMHPHVKMDDIQAQRHKEVPLSEDAQSLMEADVIDETVATLKSERDRRIQELQDMGANEARVRTVVAREFGRKIVDLARDGYDITSIVGEDSDNDQEAQTHVFPDPEAVPAKIIEVDEKPRDSDWRERQAGPGSR